MAFHNQIDYYRVINNMRWLSYILVFGLALPLFAASSSTVVCGEKLAGFVEEELHGYLFTIITEKSVTLPLRFGMSPEQFAHLHPAEDIYQDVITSLLSKADFDFDYFGEGRANLEANNHLKKLLKVTVVHRIKNLVGMHIRRARLGLREMPLVVNESGNEVPFDPTDRSLLSVAELAAIAMGEEGDVVHADLPYPSPDSGVDEGAWYRLLRGFHSATVKACADYGISISDFWASEGGAYTTTDAAEELLEQVMAWQRRGFGSLDRDQARRALNEAVARKMVEQINGVHHVRAMAIEWMETVSSAGMKEAAVRFRNYFIDAMPRDTEIEREGISKQLVSLRRPSTKRHFQEKALILVQYPPELAFAVNDTLVLSIKEGLWLRWILLIEERLTRQKIETTPDTRNQIAMALRTLLEPLILASHDVTLPDLTPAVAKQLVIAAIQKAR